MPEATMPVWTREHWAGLLLLSAANLARMSYAIEQEMLAGSRSESNALQHRACVIGATFTSVAFLEATANECFADAAEAPAFNEAGFNVPFGIIAGSLDGLSEEAIHRLGNSWNLGVPRRASYPILDKFEIALALADKEPFDRGAKPYQEVRLLVKLRNEWIHYEPYVDGTARETAPARNRGTGRSFSAGSVSKQGRREILIASLHQSRLR